jgi:uncharacterized membrane protein
MASKEIDLKKQVKKKTTKSLLVIYNVLWDVLIIAVIFICVWVLDRLARLLGMESSYLIIILNHVSEIGFIIMYLVLAVSTVYYIYKLYKE